MIITFIPQLVLVGLAGLIVLALGLRKKRVSEIGFGMILGGLSVAGISYDMFRVAHTSDVMNIPAPEPTLSDLLLLMFFLGIGLAIAIVGLLLALGLMQGHRKDSSS
jgi:hypothetical protein